MQYESLVQVEQYKRLGFLPFVKAWNMFMMGLSVAD